MLRATLKGVFAHKLRLALTGIAIIVGVGFVAGTFIFTDTIDKTFNSLFKDTFSGIDIVVQSETEFDVGFSGPPPLDEAVLDDVLSVPGVAVAEGGVFGTAVLIDKDGEAIVPAGPPAIGGSVNVDVRLDGNVVVRDGRRPTAPGEVIIDAATAKDNDFAVGDQIQVLVVIGNIDVTVVGIVGFGEADNIAGATFTGFELSEAQRVLDLEGVYNSISVISDEGVGDVFLRDQIALALPDGIEAVLAADEAADQAEQLSDALGFIQTILLVFAAIAVFVGAFIIQNTFRIIVAQRTRELALYRAVGASGSQVVWMVVTEAFIVAVLASIVGIGFGVVIAQGLTSLMSAIGFDLPSTSAELAVRTIVVGMAVGIIVTLVSAVAPAVRAAKVPPMAALQDMELRPTGGFRRRAIVGGILLTVGVFLIVNGLFGDVIDIGPINELTAIGIGALVVFIAVSVLSVLLIRPLVPVVVAVLRFFVMITRPIARTVTWIWDMAAGLVAKVIGRTYVRDRRPSKLESQLAEENSRRRPRRTAATASALMIGLALVGFFNILGASIKASVGVAIEEGLRADYVVGVGGFGGGGVSPSLAQTIEQAPEIEAATALRFNFWSNDGNDDVLTAVDTTTVALTIELGVLSGSLDALTDGGIFVSEDNAANDGLVVGDKIDMGFAATGLQQVEVVGTFENTNVVGANYVSGLAFYEANFSEQLDFAIYVKAANGVPEAAARAAVEAAAADFPNVDVNDQVEYREDQEAQVDSLLALFQALLFLAVLIALIGITNTLVLSIYERTREIGLLRAVGMSRRQVKRMVRWEAVVVAVIGGVFGVIVGVFFGAIVVSALGSQGITELSIPVVQILLLLVIAAIAGVLAAYFPARRASRLNILEAISYE